MTLQECMQRVSQREYELWSEWLNQQWNDPSRSDHYLMQIAAEVRRVLHKRPEKVKTSHFKIPFKTLTPEEIRERNESAKRSSEEAVAASQKFWMSLVGMFKHGDRN